EPEPKQEPKIKLEPEPDLEPESEPEPSAKEETSVPASNSEDFSTEGTPVEGNRFAQFRNIYSSRDDRLCLFEDADGHLIAVDSSKFA
ncbi:MAG: hypothetical protein RR997_06585, partial [Raoultibacter sp.]